MVLEQYETVTHVAVDESIEPWSYRREVWLRWLSHHRPQWKVYSILQHDQWKHKVVHGFTAQPDYSVWQPCFWSWKYIHARRLFVIDEEESNKYLKAVEREILAAQHAPWWAQFTYPCYRSPNYDLASHLSFLSGAQLTTYAEHPSWQSHPLYVDYCTAGPKIYYRDPETGEIIPPFCGGAGNTYFVATAAGGGNNANPGTINSPKLTIWGATGGCSLLTSGDMLVIKAGTYSSSSDFIDDLPGGQHIPGGVSSITPTVIRADTGATVTVNPTAFHAMRLKQIADHITFQDVIYDGINLTNGGVEAVVKHFRQDNLLTTGLKFTRCTIKRGPGVGLQTIGVSAGEVIDCILDTNQQVDGGAPQGRSNHYGEITDGVIRGNTSFYSPTRVTRGGACLRNAANAGDWYSTNNTVQERNLCYGANGYCMTTGSGAGQIVRNNILHTNVSVTLGTDACLLVYGDRATSNTKIYNNTMWNAANCSGVRIGFGGSTITGTLIKNNIIKLTIRGIEQGAQGSSTILDYTLFHQVTSQVVNSGGSLTQTNTIVADPLFVSTASGNFHLQATSPAINAGINLSPDVTTDYDSVVRPQGLSYDVGAFEALTTDTTPPAVPTGLQVL